MTEKTRSQCPISCTLDVLGDKWSLLIIRDLMLHKKCTYGDFLKSPEGIATNILASRLKLLEDNQIIDKREHPESKTKNWYMLTPKGIDLMPLLVEIHLWADKHLNASSSELLPLVKNDKEGFVKHFKKELQEARNAEAERFPPAR